MYCSVQLLGTVVLYYEIVLFLLRKCPFAPALLNYKSVIVPKEYLLLYKSDQFIIIFFSIVCIIVCFLENLVLSKLEIYWMYTNQPTQGTELL